MVAIRYTNIISKLLNYDVHFLANKNGVQEEFLHQKQRKAIGLTFINKIKKFKSEAEIRRKEVRSSRQIVQLNLHNRLQRPPKMPLEELTEEIEDIIEEIIEPKVSPKLSEPEIESEITQSHPFLGARSQHLGGGR